VVAGDAGTVVGAGACRVCPAGAPGWVLVLLLPHAANPTAAAAARASPATIFRTVRPLSVIAFPPYVTHEAPVTYIATYGTAERIAPKSQKSGARGPKQSRQRCRSGRRLGDSPADEGPSTVGHLVRSHGGWQRYLPASRCSATDVSSTPRSKKDCAPSSGGLTCQRGLARLARVQNDNLATNLAAGAHSPASRTPTGGSLRPKVLPCEMALAAGNWSAGVSAV
jgi:hypothetical protein